MMFLSSGCVLYKDGRRSRGLEISFPGLRAGLFRKTLLPRVIELLREADNPKFDQKSPM